MKTGYPSIDKPWLKYYPAGAAERPLPAKTAYAFVYDKRCNDGHSIALEYLGVKITYKKLFFMIESTAKAFKNLGISKVDIVTLALPTMPETVYIFYALDRLGAITNAIDPRLTAGEFAQNIQQTNSKILVTLDMCLPIVSDVLAQTKLESVIFLTPTESLPLPVQVLMAIKGGKKASQDSRIVSWKQFLHGGQNYNGPIDAPYWPNTPAAIVHTGGTTGAPKGVVLTNENFNAMAFTQEISEYELQEHDTFLTFLPPFIAYCLVNAIHDPLYLGFRNVLVPKFAPEDFPSLMMKYQPNHVLAGPILWDYFIKSELTQNADLSYIKSPISGGDAMNLELEKQINTFFQTHGCKHKVAQGYGMTEVSAAACFSTDDSYTPGSVGIPYIKNVISIFDPDTGSELTYDQQGEICIQSPTMMLEYYNNPSATAEVIRQHADGKLWVHTGDIGHMNANGNLFVDGRMKRMIVRSGNKIFPSAVEEVILTHSAVDNCIIVQMPSQTERHVPVAHIILHDEAEPEKTISEIDDLVVRSLPAFNIPSLYILRDDLPLTAINKVDYKKLEEESVAYQDVTRHIVTYDTQAAKQRQL